MLLFIVNQAGALDTSLGFQNISCYCLSGNDDSLKSKIVISKHLMLLFIDLQLIHSNSKKTISKHLMLLFITTMDSAISSKKIISKHLMLLFIPRISAFFSFSPPLFPLIFSIFLHFLPANTLILDRPTYHPINLLFFQAFLDFSFFFRLVKIL